MANYGEVTSALVAQHVNNDVSCAGVLWETEPRTTIGTGCEPFPFAFQQVGPHTIKARVTRYGRAAGW